MRFERGCSHLPIYRTTDPGSVRWFRPGSATGAGCFALCAGSFAEEILIAARHAGTMPAGAGLQARTS